MIVKSDKDVEYLIGYTVAKATSSTNSFDQTYYKELVEALNELRIIKSDVGEFSDGCHTFNSLYRQRLILSVLVVNAYKDKAWKSHKHEDGAACFGGGWFLVCIDTPKGQYAYYYEDKYWDLFDCQELERAKHFDGHSDKDVDRLLSLLE